MSESEELILTDEEVLAIHRALHDPEAKVVVIRGKEYTVFKKDGYRKCHVLGLMFAEQNRTKSSEYALAARNGSQITWVIPAGRRKWGQVVDGTIHCRTLGMEKVTKTKPKASSRKGASAAASSSSIMRGKSTVSTSDSHGGASDGSSMPASQVRRQFAQPYWAWQNDQGDYERYGGEVDELIEAVYALGHPVAYIDQGPWEIRFADMLQVNSDSKRIRKIKRVVPAEVDEDEKTDVIPPAEPVMVTQMVVLPMMTASVNHHSENNVGGGSKSQIKKDEEEQVDKNEAKLCRKRSGPEPSSSDNKHNENNNNNNNNNHNHNNNNNNNNHHAASASASAASSSNNNNHASAAAESSATKRAKSIELVEQWLISPKSVILGKRLGAGAYGEVRRGTYHGADVAVKIMHISDSTSEDEKRKLRKSFSEETMLLCRLRHPNIVAYHGASIADMMLVMEYCPQSLQDALKRAQGPLPGKTLLSVALGIAAGMGYLHAQVPAVIHRDLKPGNILLDARLVPKIADFGISRQDDAECTMTKIGTPIYSAPEVLLDKKYDHKIDVFSFGIMLCEMATGIKPYSDQGKGGGALQILKKVAKHQQRPTLPKPCAEYPAELVQLIQDCWVHIPSQRLDFVDIFNVLSAISKGLPVPNGASSSTTRIDQN